MNLEFIGKLAIPRGLRSQFARHKFKDAFEIYKNSHLVDTDWADNLNCLVTTGFVDWHDDREITSYSGLLIVQNSFGGYVQVKHEKVVKDQPPGTLILLNTKDLHRLAVPGDYKTTKGIWAAVFKDYDEKPSHAQVLKDFRRDLEDYRERHRRRTRSLEQGGQVINSNSPGKVSTTWGL